MLLDALLPMLEKVTKKGSGYMACCPAHPDKSPSLSIDEGEGGKPLLYCFAGCSLESICLALGVRVRDLFEDDLKQQHSQRPNRRPRPMTSQERAFQYEIAALDYEQKAQKIFAAAKDCEDCGTWTDEDRELAMQAVSVGYRAEAKAAWCRAYADHLRSRRHDLA